MVSLYLSDVNVMAMYRKGGKKGTKGSMYVWEIHNQNTVLCFFFVPHFPLFPFPILRLLQSNSKVLCLKNKATYYRTVIPIVSIFVHICLPHWRYTFKINVA